MDKQKAIEMLGGSVTKAANAIGIRPQAVSRWPDILTPKISDRVYAALARQQKQGNRKPATSITPRPHPSRAMSRRALAG